MTILERRVTLQGKLNGDSPMPQFDEISTSRGAMVVSTDVAFESGRPVLKASLFNGSGSPPWSNPYARCNLNNNQLVEGDTVYLAFAFRLPASFDAAQVTQIDIMRITSYDDPATGPNNENRIVFTRFNGDRKFRMQALRWNTSTGAYLDTPIEIVPSFTLSPVYDVWHRVVIKLKLSRTNGVAENTVWINGTQVGTSTTRNIFTAGVKLTTWRHGIVNGSTDQGAITAYFDEVRQTATALTDFTGTPTPPPAGTAPTKGTIVKATSGGVDGTSVTTAAMPAGLNRGYDVTVSTRGYRDITLTNTGGLTFTEKEQPGGRSQAGIARYTAFGSPPANWTITAQHGGAAARIAVTVVPIDGADPANPCSAIASQNTNGPNGAGTGGTDNPTPTVSITPAKDQSLIINSFCARGLISTGFTYDSDYTLRDSNVDGEASIYTLDRVLATAAADTITHNTSATNVDWASAAVAWYPIPEEAPIVDTIAPWVCG